MLRKIVFRVCGLSIEVGADRVISLVVVSIVVGVQNPGRLVLVGMGGDIVVLGRGVSVPLVETLRPQ